MKARAYEGKSFGRWSAVKAVTVKKSTALSDAKAEAAKWRKEAGAAKAEAAKYKGERDAVAPITITYDADGGTIPAGAKTKLEKSEGAYTLPTPSKRGFNFEG